VHHHCPGVPCLIVGTQVDLREDSQVRLQRLAYARSLLSKRMNDNELMTPYDALGIGKVGAAETAACDYRGWGATRQGARSSQVRRMFRADAKRAQECI